MPQFNAFIARTLHGLEELTWQDIQRHTNSTLVRFAHRTIEFSSSVELEQLLALRSVEDIFVFIGELKSLSHERSSLQAISNFAKTLKLKSTLEICRRIRSIPVKPDYSITASFLGTRNYNRWDIASAFKDGLREAEEWNYVENREQSTPPHDLHFRILIEEGRAIFGIRLGKLPLHKRPFLVASRPARLSPVVAYHMIRLSDLKPGEHLLDPFCGSGLIPIEASFYEPEAIISGLDTSADAIKDCQLNLEAVQSSIAIARGDASKTGFEPESVDVIVSDLPWGHQSELEGSSLDNTLKEFRRILKPQGRLILLIENPEDLISSLKNLKLQICGCYQVSLHGKHPQIVSAKLSQPNLPYFS